MKSRRIGMSLEDYERLPFKLGWKQEYFGGCLVETPREVIVHATVPVARRAIETDLPLRVAVASDEASLQPVFRRAFADTIEFCDYPEAKVHDAARESLARFFHGPLRGTLSTSCVAFAPSGTEAAGQPVGAALVAVEPAGWAQLEMIFVAPEWQRRGVAMALAARVVTALLEFGGVRTLVSRYHIGNEASRAWHQHSGFVDEPDLLVARLRARAAVTPDERDGWEHEAARIEALFEAGCREEAFATEKWHRTRRK